MFALVQTPSMGVHCADHPTTSLIPQVMSLENLADIIISLHTHELCVDKRYTSWTKDNLKIISRSSVVNESCSLSKAVNYYILLQQQTHYTLQNKDNVSL